jgi:hypothetical protein
MKCLVVCPLVLTLGLGNSAIAQTQNVPAARVTLFRCRRLPLRPLFGRMLRASMTWESTLEPRMLDLVRLLVG